jgi:hypothetical protein
MQPLTRFTVVLIHCLVFAGCASSTKGNAKIASSEPLPTKASIETMAPAQEALQYFVDKYGAGHVLMVFDVDNTLLTSATPLGSDQWFGWQYGLPVGDPRRIWPEDFDCLLDAQELLYFTTPMRLTHPTVASLTSAARRMGVRQWVVTSRGPEFSSLTFRELRRQGLAFSPFRNEGTSVETPTFDEQLMRMEDGVLFTAGKNKGVAFMELLKHIDVYAEIKAFVFVDDTQRHIDRMETAFAGSGMETRSYLYTAMKADVDAFLSDEAAKKDATSAWCALVPSIRAVEDAVSHDILDLTHDVNGTRTSLSSCMVEVCK